MKPNKTNIRPRNIGDASRLDLLAIGMSGTITKVNGEGRIKRRLFDMGLSPGAEDYLRKKAPLGDPIEITIRGYELTLRKSEASFVEVEEEKGDAQ